MSSVVKLSRADTACAESVPARLLVVGAQYFNDTMEWHVVEAARALGCAAEFFEARAFRALGGAPHKALLKAANLLLREPERLYERRLLAAVERSAPQLVLVILGNQLSPKTVQLLRSRTNAPIVCWCQDQMTTLGRQYLIGAGYDAVFVKDRYLQELFSRMVRSTPFHYLPEACNPRVHRSVQLSAEDRAALGCDVMIAGSLYYYRQEILRALGEFDLRIHGSRPSWLIDRLSGRVVRPEVWGDDKVRAVRAAGVALNTLHYAEVDAINCRAFELAGCGAFQLIDHKPVLAEHFRVGEEIETFRTLDELIAKIRHFLAQPERAQAIAAAGQRRAHREHSYEARLREIFAVTRAARVEFA
jgi:spore maturation protein CgeB